MKNVNVKWNCYKLTGYKRKTIEAFMCGTRESDAVVNVLAQTLSIDR